MTVPSRSRGLSAALHDAWSTIRRLQIVASATPLIQRADHPAGDDDNAEIFAGQRWVVVEDADYVFREPPRQISTKQKGGTIDKTWVDAPAEATWRDTIGYLVSLGKVGQAATIMERWLTAPAEWVDPEAGVGIRMLVMGGARAPRWPRATRARRDAADISPT